jgi:hypothetical protein
MAKREQIEVQFLGGAFMALPLQFSGDQREIYRKARQERQGFYLCALRALGGKKKAPT